MFLRLLDECSPAAVLLPAAVQATPAATAVGDDIEVPDFGGQSVPAAQQFPIQDDAAADSGADGQDDDMGFTAGRAQPDLRPRGGVGVVSHDDRQPEPVAPRLTQMFVAPGKVRCEERLSSTNPAAPRPTATRG